MVLRKSDSFVANSIDLINCSMDVIGGWTPFSDNVAEQKERIVQCAEDLILL